MKRYSPSPITEDFSNTHLLAYERRALRRLRLRGRIPEADLGDLGRKLYVEGFIARNSANEHDPLGQVLSDGTVSLTEKYFRYLAYKREQFFNRAVWPAIVGGIVSLVISIGCYILLFRAIAHGIANVTVGELLRLLISQ